ncbi:ImmA/IrrE family metallo-endopeptidase [Mesorhizobium sp. M0614]|uniref:ImmA/IrrE family metallo-endopeptidase n=1 Tax=Mesorhizobium sp. M0614 TaxID=2956970 RepID=UPI00333756C2
MAKLLREANRIITLWRSHGPNTPKIDLEKIFQEIILPSSNGDVCKIVYEPFDSFEGLMARQNDSREWRIGVNTSIKYAPRRNFTLAHEMGHFIGHRYEQDVFECSFDNLNDFQNTGFELEANEFASQLLMPADILRSFDKNREFCHAAITELASMFGVSRTAAAYRWIKLTSRQIGFVISRDGHFNQGRASERLYKLGVFFRQGQEAPAGSLIHLLGEIGQEMSEIVESPVWHNALPCRESSYATTQNGYIYTYLDFDRC